MTKGIKEEAEEILKHAREYAIKLQTKPREEVLAEFLKLLTGKEEEETES